MVDVEVVVLWEHEGWEVETIQIPEVIAKLESQDAFIKWLYSDDPAAVDLLRGWKHGMCGAYMWRWPRDLAEDDRG